MADLYSSSHSKKCCRKTPKANCCSKNIRNAVAAYNDFASGNIPGFLSFFAPGGTITFYGGAAKCPGGQSIIPFAGTFPALQFLELLNTYLVNFTPGPITDVEFDCDTDHVSLTASATAAAVCAPGGPPGPSVTVSQILKFTFNDEHQITSIEIYQDTSALTLFYFFECNVCGIFSKSENEKQTVAKPTNIPAKPANSSVKSTSSAKPAQAAVPQKK